MTEENKLTNLRDRYNQCESWINSHDKSKIELLMGDIKYNNSDNLSLLQRTLYWFKHMSELNDDGKKILFGDILLTIVDIKERMIKHLKYEESFEDDEDDEDIYGDYDDDGHASQEGYRNVVSYFESLDEDSLMSIAYGSTQDDYEIDINGGRSYLMNGSNIYLYIFNYLYYTKKVTLKEYEDDIFNSGDASDTIEEFYLENFYLPSDEEFDKMYERKYKEKYQKSFDRYNSFVDDIIKNFNNDPMLNELVSEMKKLKADDAYIQSKVREIQIDKLIK